MKNIKVFSTKSNLELVLIFLALFFIFYSGYFIIGLFNPTILTDLDINDFSTRYYKEAIHHLNKYILSTAFHVMTGVILLCLGILQQHERLRKSQPRLHKVIGYSYLIVGIIGVGSGSIIASHTLGGAVAQLGFLFTGMLWFFSAFKMYYYASKINLGYHRLWAMRNFSVAASTGLMRPNMVLFDKLFVSSSPGEIFTMGIWTSTCVALVIWVVLREKIKDL